MRYLLILSAFIFLTGCKSYQYVSPPHYVPVNTKKGDLVTNLSNNFYQVGYAFTDHFSVYSTGSIIANKPYFYKDLELTGHKLTPGDKFTDFNLGFSHFKTFNDKLSLEFVYGVGTGSVYYFDTNLGSGDEYYYYDPKWLKAKKVSFCAQPNFSFRYKEYLDLSAFARINYNQYYNIAFKYLDSAPTDPYVYNEESVNLLFVEPGIQLRAGFKNIKLMIQYSKPLNIGFENIIHRTDNIFVGISLNFNVFEPLE